MPPDPEVDEDYASSEDSDFAPEEAGAGEARESSPDESEDESGKADDEQQKATERRKRKHDGDQEAEDLGFENSGDEAIIDKGKKRRKKAKDKGRVAPGEDEDGEEDRIKTRSQRAVEKAERKFNAPKGPVTIDVDSLWAQMIAEPSAASKNRSSGTATTSDAPGTAGDTSGKAAAPDTSPRKDGTGDASATIKIKRKYNFAGVVHVEEKVVLRDSAEARLYLETLAKEGGDPNAAIEAEEEERPKAKPRKAFRSAFEPISDNLAQRSDLNLGMAARIRAREQAQEANAKKLTTVEKSRMDWAGFVDKEGIRDELVLAGKSKDSYAERERFLATSEARREGDARQARMAAKA